MAATTSDQTPAHPVSLMPTYGTLFCRQPLADVQEAAAAARWMLDEIAKNPEAFGPAVRAAFVEVRGEAERELSDRRARPAAAPLLADLELAKERVDLAGYIAHRCGAQFRRCGAELLARCPFPQHPDVHPSFRVNPAKGLWKCWGCGRGGDILSFLMLWDGVTFKEAAQSLLWEAGLPVPTSPPLAATGPGGRVWAPVRGGGRRGH